MDKPMESRTNMSKCDLQNAEWLMDIMTGTYSDRDVELCAHGAYMAAESGSPAQYLYMLVIEGYRLDLDDVAAHDKCHHLRIR